MDGDGIMCCICGQYPCHSQCPNYECNRVGDCEQCGEELYEEYEIWTDDNGNKFCSEDCAKDYYGIKEINY